MMGLIMCLVQCKRISGAQPIGNNTWYSDVWAYHNPAMNNKICRPTWRALEVCMHPQSPLNLLGWLCLGLYSLSLCTCICAT